MTEALRSLKRDLSGSDAEKPPTEDMLRASLHRFSTTRDVASFTELKYVCYGVTVPVGISHWRIIDQSPLFSTLLDLVQQREDQPKQFRRCYQGLLNGYFGFDRYSDAEGPGKGGWVKLRGFLSEKLRPILKSSAHRGLIPDWLQTLNMHQNLLTDDPCSRYADGLVRGDTGELKDVCAGLGVAASSWVWEDALMAYVHLLCKSDDTEFRQGLPGILKLVNGNSDLKLPPSLATRATAMAVGRYSRCKVKTEHPELRDTAVHWVGNPWLKRTAWDVYVKHEPARQMIESWLKRRLITDFFELLAQDGAADLKRLKYWLKWEPQITDMWFVLGADARNNRSTDFMDLRKRMAGRDRTLTDNNSQNNAFVMRIGSLLVIEFGVVGNACYAFAASDFYTSLEKMVFSIYELKQKALATRLSHRSHWEGRFDDELKRLLQTVPTSKGDLRAQEEHPVTPIDRRESFQMVEKSKWASHPKVSEPAANNPFSLAPKTTTPATTSSARPSSIKTRKFSESDFTTVCTLCAQHGIEWDDNRPKRGALWILLPNRKKRPAFSSLLDRYGFRYTEGKGFWLKEQD
ncbi:MAG: EH signature domain-containing protein [Polaromonas sp.]